MHPKFLDLLCCPQTGESFTLIADETRDNGMVWSGVLRTPSNVEYPIVRGVPRFVKQELYASSFGFEWARWPRVQFEAENVGRPMAGHTSRMWSRITGGIADADIVGKTIVDFGCGPGRFLDIVRRRGGLAVGIDLSGAVDAARTNFEDDPNVLIVQGDLLNPPFRDGAFDGGFSIGVLHHTPAPAKGVAALVRSIREGGWVSTCVYPKGQFYDFPSVRRMRKLHLMLKPKLGYRFALAYAAFSARNFAPLNQWLRWNGAAWLSRFLERHVLVSLSLPDERWRLLDVFDAITPEIASTHTSHEVSQWLAEAGCEDVRRTPWCDTSFAAARRRAIEFRPALAA